MDSIMVFEPTWDEFKNFEKYILYMEARGAHLAGAAKIIPPPEWNPRKNGYDIDNMSITIPQPMLQVVTGKQGFYQQMSIHENGMTVQQYRDLTNQDQYRTPTHATHDELEYIYWREITNAVSIYATDIDDTLFDEDCNEWNVNRLGTILDYIKHDYCVNIGGLITSYIYFGMWKSTFVWHLEDMDLYAINYLHFGQPKSWYVIPPQYSRQFEKLAGDHFLASQRFCGAFLRHKTTIISPQVLEQNSIPFNKITQNEREIIVVFPFAYHFGFNHGFNCAESSNFAMPRWIDYGKWARHCSCSPDALYISMDTFVKRFQPHRYELWRSGKDLSTHPEEPLLESTAAPKPLVQDFLININNTIVPDDVIEAAKNSLLTVPKPKQYSKKHPDIHLPAIRKKLKQLGFPFTV